MAETFRVGVPPDFTQSDRSRFGKLVVEYIIRRTKQGLGIGRVKLGNYSEAYKESKEFDIAGKSGSRVNLTLTGDMLDDLDVISTFSGSVNIGYEGDTDANSKARWMREKGYRFLGLADEERSKLLSQFNSESSIKAEVAPSISESFLRRILSGN